MEFSLRMMIGMLVPLGVFTAVVQYQKYRRAQNKVRSPVSDKMLRPPGESLRLRLEELDADYYTWFFLSLWTAGLAALLLSSRPMLLVPVALFVAGTLRKTWITRNKYRDVSLGFSGERLVAQELAPLMAEGCQIFHDFPTDTLGNIDHIVVAPSGVYAVETKARRKRKASKGQEEHKLVFDGRALQFPNGYSDTAALDQARRNAEWLSTYLTKATGERVPVTPILTYPGWYIDLKSKPEFPIAAPKMIRFIVTGGAEILDAKRRQQIAFQVEQKVRDVEF